MDNWYRIQAALLSAVLCFALGVAVALRQRHSMAPARFIGLAANLSSWFLLDSLALSDLLDTGFLLLLKGLCLSMFPTTVTQLMNAFSDEKRPMAGYIVMSARLVSLLGLLGAFTIWAISYYKTLPYEAYWRYLDHTMVAATVIHLALSVLLMVRRIQSVELHSERMQLVSLTISISTVFLLVLLAYGFDFGIAWLGNMLPTTFLFFLYQIITLRRILDVSEFIGRVLVFGGIAAILSLIYAFMVGWWRHDFGLFVFSSFISTIVILILIDPVKNFIESRLSEMLFKDRFEFTKMTEHIRSSLKNIIDIGGMTDLIMAQLENSKQLTHASLWLRDEEGLVWQRLGFVGTAPPAYLDGLQARPFLTRLTQKKLLTTDSLQSEIKLLLEELEPQNASAELPGQGAEQLSQHENLEAILETMALFDGQLVVALVSSQQASPLRDGFDRDPQQELLGFLSIKNERLEEAWSADETRAMVAIATQATLIIENSRLFDRIREKDRLAAIGQMAAGLAHEIRNPLGAIKGASQLLFEVEEDQRDTFLQIILEEVQRLDTVVSQFLTYARPLKGKLDLVDINQVVERSLSLVQAELYQSHIDFQPTYPLASIYSDAELIRQVTLNLARNALEAMMAQGGGTLTISTRVVWRSENESSLRRGSYIMIRFEDEGPGMPQEVLDRLFIPFYTTKDSGTGLGLAICQRIIENLDGTIEVQSKVGEGSTFSVFLPRIEATDNEERP